MPRCEATIHTAPVSPSSSYLHTQLFADVGQKYHYWQLKQHVPTHRDVFASSRGGFGRIGAEVRLFSSTHQFNKAKFVIQSFPSDIIAKQSLLHCHPIQSCFLMIPREGWSLPQRQEHTLEYLEKTQTGTGGTCKLHIEKAGIGRPMC